MKKIQILVITLLTTMLISQSVMAFGTNKKLDFAKGEADAEASKILYEYVLQEQGMTSVEIKSFAGIEPQSAKAFEVDLNDDGINEIIGFVNSTLYWGTAGYSLFILQKQPNGYKNIAYLLNFEPQKDFYILNTGTNGYRNIKLHGSSAYKFKPFTVKYEDGHYRNNSQTKSLENSLQQ